MRKSFTTHSSRGTFFRVFFFFFTSLHKYLCALRNAQRIRLDSKRRKYFWWNTMRDVSMAEGLREGPSLGYGTREQRTRCCSIYLESERARGYNNGERQRLARPLTGRVDWLNNYYVRYPEQRRYEGGVRRVSQDISTWFRNTIFAPEVGQLAARAGRPLSWTNSSVRSRRCRSGAERVRVEGKVCNYLR